MIIAKKSLGQNFLIDKNIINKIIRTIEITNKNIIEIGPGLGALTEKILEKKPNKLIIIEKDFELYKKLLNKFDKKKITIINDDALLYNFSEFKNFKLISNYKGVNFTSNLEIIRVSPSHGTAENLIGSKRVISEGIINCFNLIRKIKRNRN